MKETIGRYRIQRILGEGGMGVVYGAVDESLGRPVAIKMIRQANADERTRERLRREARAAASVNHPNICQLYEVSEEDGELFIVMELLEGESLAARIGRQPLSLSEATEAALSMLAALEALHRRGIVHRDLKPSNVFLTPVGLKLLDFGLARPMDSASAQTEAGLTLPGTIVGTPHYLAPEQLLDQRVDARSDLFAAGAVIFEMLSGKSAFGGRSLPQITHAVLYEQPPALSGSPAIAALGRIVHRALRKRPEERYQSAGMMADDLRAAMLMADTRQGVRAVAMTRLMVLPFRILRSDPETDFLAFSLPDDLTTTLSEIEPLVVRSSVTASRFANETPDLEAIAGTADVDVVLTGTLLRAGDQLRVNTQLVATPGGAVLWSQTSQVLLGDIFKLQDELTHRIVESLATPLGVGERATPKKDVPASAKAYEFYLRANQLGSQASTWSLARDLYLQCLEEDPRFAPAWARLGRIYRVITIYTGESPEENFERAHAAFTRALEINPDLSIAHNLYTNHEVELRRAEEALLRLLKRAQERAGDPELFAGLVQACRYSGMLDAAVAAHERARQLDPAIRTAIAHAYLAQGDTDRAATSGASDPPVGALALELMGRDAEAIDLIRQWEQTHPPRLLLYYLIATRALLEGNRSECLEATEKIVGSWYFRDPCGRYYLARHLAARRGLARPVNAKGFGRGRVLLFPAPGPRSVA